MSDRDRWSNLTREQRLALAVRGASVALGAGAGCGKTTVLTERFLGALDGADGLALPVHSVVAVTFTEKAARELRQRIRAACHDRLKSAPADQARVWRAVLRGLEAAPVSTFHEYCSSLLRRHALAARIDPDFAILDESLAGAVRDASVARCIRRWLAEENEDLVALAVEFGLSGVRDSVAGLVARRDATEIQVWEGRTVDEVVADWERFQAERVRPIARGELVKAARDCASCVGSYAFGHPKLVAFRRELLAGLADVGALADDSEWVGGPLKASAYMPKGLKVTHWPSPEINKSVTKSCETFRKAIGEWLVFGEFDPASARLGAELGLRFARLAAEARRAYDDAKRARGGLDFDDLLVKTRDFLRVHAALVRNDPVRPPAFVLVDEFQDTDPVQAEILRLLTGDDFTGGRLFVVGDFKQSIYRFRGARPEIFQGFRGEFPEGGRRELSQNFRSTTGVIDFVNAVFADAFPGELPRLIPGPAAHAASDGPCVELVWADEGEDESEKKLKVAEGRGTEAQWLARLLRERLDAGWPVRDRATGAVRDAHPGDVAFLFRAMTDTYIYERALANEGLDYHVVGGSAFYAQQEVQDVVNVLSALEDPLDSVALAGALRSPFFGLSDVALYWLAEGDGDGLSARLGDPSAGWLARLAPDDRRRAARARTLLARWAALKDRLPIAGLLDRVLVESGYEPALLGEFLGDRKRANARKLVRLARRFDARGGFTLAQFVARLREDLRDPPREGEAATTDEDGTSVRLMTVHQAKGLEFPIVVLPDLNRRSANPHAGVTFDPDLGPLVRLGKEASGPAELGGEDGGPPGGESLGWALHKRIEDAESDAEGLRLFYVAATRARDVLILSSAGKPEQKAASPALRLLGERFDVRTGECRASLPDGWAVPTVRVTTAPPPAPLGGPTGSRRPDLAAIAHAITSAPLRKPAPPLPAAGPRSIDLDAVLGLPPREARVDRLMRSILDEPDVVKADGLAPAARRAARRQVPVAHGAVVDEAVRLAAACLEGRLGTLLTTSESVVRGFEWCVRWPEGRPATTTVRGRADFLARDAQGTWTAVVVSPPGADRTSERLRLLLSARAAKAQGYEPLGQGWLVTPGEGLTVLTTFDADVVNGAYRDVSHRS